MTVRGKKGIAERCVRAVLYNVEVEIRLVKERAEYPERFIRDANDGPLAIWRSENTKTDISEMAIGICEAKVLWTTRGTLMGYDEVIKLAEQVFGVGLPNYRELKRDVFKRTRNVAKFLDQLVFLIEEAQRRKDAR